MFTLEVILRAALGSYKKYRAYDDDTNHWSNHVDAAIQEAKMTQYASYNY